MTDEPKSELKLTPDTDDLELVHEDSETKGGFYLRREGKELGELRYEWKDDSTIVIKHTEVDESLRGQGRARQLLEATVKWLRDENHKMLSDCPYVTRRIEKDASLQDVVV